MTPVLPDVLLPGLTIVFCGTAAGTVSAQRGAYYAHPQNKFWRTLHDTGLTPRRYKPEEFAVLPQLGIGLTDIAKQAFGMDSELPRHSLGCAATDALRERILDVAPRILAFTSLTGGRRFLGSKVTLGPDGNRRRDPSMGAAFAVPGRALELGRVGLVGASLGG